MTDDDICMLMIAVVILTILATAFHYQQTANKNSLDEIINKNITLRCTPPDEHKVFEEINKIRANQLRKPLKWSEYWHMQAKEWAKFLSSLSSITAIRHSHPNYTFKWGEIIAATEYSISAEGIVEMWRKSRDHYRIMTGDWKYGGVGCDCRGYEVCELCVCVAQFANVERP